MRDKGELEILLLLRASEISNRCLEHKNNVLELYDPFKKSAAPHFYRFGRIYEPTDHQELYREVACSLVGSGQSQLLVLIGQPSQSRQSFQEGGKGLIDRSSERNILLMKLASELFSKGGAASYSFSCCLIISSMEVADLLSPEAEVTPASSTVAIKRRAVKAESSFSKCLQQALKRASELQGRRSSAECYNLVFQLHECGEDKEKRITIIESSRTLKEHKEKDPK